LSSLGDSLAGDAVKTKIDQCCQFLLGHDAFCDHEHADVMADLAEPSQEFLVASVLSNVTYISAVDLQIIESEFGQLGNIAKMLAKMFDPEFTTRGGQAEAEAPERLEVPECPILGYFNPESLASFRRLFQQLDHGIAETPVCDRVGRQVDRNLRGLVGQKIQCNLQCIHVDRE